MAFMSPGRYGLSDTSPDVERVHLRLLREAGPVRRAAIALDLSAAAIEATRQGLRRRHPELSEEEIGLRFVALCYGQDLADRVRAYLDARKA
jgi:hypothetical protein